MCRYTQRSLVVWKQCEKQGKHCRTQYLMVQLVHEGKMNRIQQIKTEFEKWSRFHRALCRHPPAPPGCRKAESQAAECLTERPGTQQGFVLAHLSFIGNNKTVYYSRNTPPMVWTSVVMPPGKVSWGEGRFHSHNVAQWENILHFLSFLFEVYARVPINLLFTLQTFCRWRRITHSYFVPVFGCLIAPTNYPVPAVSGDPATRIWEKLHPRRRWSKIPTLTGSDNSLF